MTSDEAAFMAAIRAAAWDDELPHLVFADWLDEQGRDDEATERRRYAREVLPALKVLAYYCTPPLRTRLEAHAPGAGDELRELVQTWREEDAKGTRYGDEEDWPDFAVSRDPRTDEDEKTFTAAFRVVTGATAIHCIGRRPCAC